jgi:hygromycin-B 7''-O-kinase
LEIFTKEHFERNFRADFWIDFAKSICRRNRISYTRLHRSAHGENVVVLVDDRLVIKIYTPFRQGFTREKAALEFTRGKTGLPVPEITHAGEIEGFNYLMTTQLRGGLLTRDEWLKLETREQIAIVSQLAKGLRELHSHNPNAIHFDWQKFIERQAASVLARQTACGANPQWLRRLPSYLEETLPLLPPDLAPVFLHGDVHFGNLRLIEIGGHWQISGLFDFGDSLKGFHEYEFVAIGVLMIQGQGQLQREFFRAYGYRDSQMDETLRRRLMLLTILYESSDLRKYALRLRPEAVDFTLDELERAIWNFT